MDALQDIMLSERSQAQDPTDGIILFLGNIYKKANFLEKCFQKWLPEAGNKNGD